MICKQKESTSDNHVRLNNGLDTIFSGVPALSIISLLEPEVDGKCDVVANGISRTMIRNFDARRRRSCIIVDERYGRKTALVDHVEPVRWDLAGLCDRV